MSFAEEAYRRSKIKLMERQFELLKERNRLLREQNELLKVLISGKCQTVEVVSEKEENDAN